MWVQTDRRKYDPSTGIQAGPTDPLEGKRESVLIHYSLTDSCSQILFIPPLKKRDAFCILFQALAEPCSSHYPTLPPQAPWT